MRSTPSAPAPDPTSSLPPGDPDAYERWRLAYCDADPTGSCRYDASFLSPPPALLAYYPFAGLDAGQALLAVSTVQALLFVGGMVLVWRIVAPADVGQERLLLIAAVCVTPVVANVVILGQNTGFVFVLGLGVASTSRLATVARGAALAVASLLKLFPALLVLVAALRRRGEIVLAFALCLAACLLLSALLFPSSLWRGFLDVLAVYRDNAPRHEFNRSFDALLRASFVPDLEVGVLTTATLLARLAVLGWIWFRWIRPLPAAVEWTWVLVAAVVVNDYSWPHYLVLLLPYAAVLVRELEAPPVLVPVAGVLGSVAVATWSSPLLGGLLFQGVVLAALLLPVAFADRWEAELRGLGGRNRRAAPPPSAAVRPG